jgi:hypothetical protein
VSGLTTTPQDASIPEGGATTPNDHQSNKEPANNTSSLSPREFNGFHLPRFLGNALAPQYTQVSLPQRGALCYHGRGLAQLS